MNKQRLKKIADNNAYGSDLIVPWREVAQMARELLALQPKWIGEKMTTEQLKLSVEEIRAQVTRIAACQPVHYLLEAKDALRKILTECSKLEAGSQDDRKS